VSQSHVSIGLLDHFAFGLALTIRDSAQRFEQSS
jgi:hypothetical protein